MATITNSIGTGGRDYSTIQAWEDALPANLVTDGNSYVGECYNDSEFAPAGKITIGGQTTDSTHTITLKCAAGHSFYDHANKLTNALRYNQSNGVGVLLPDVFSGVGMEITSQYVTVDGIQFRSIYSSYVSGSAMLMVSASNCNVINCIGAFSPAGGNLVAIFGTSGNSNFVNCLVYGTGARSVSGFNSYAGGAVVNCTAAYLGADTASTSYGIFRDYGTPLIQNVAGFGFRFFAKDTTGASGSGNNATNLAAGNTPGSSNVNGLTTADQFQSITISSEDFRVKSGSGLVAGVRAQSYTADLDIVKSARSTSVPTIGAWEFAAAGGTTISPGVASLTITGYAPTIAQTASQTISPSTASLAITGYAPTIAQSANQAISPGAANLVITGYPPTVEQAAGSQNIAPGAASLVISGYPPTIQQASAGGFSGGFAEVPQVRRSKSVQQEREDLGIIPRRVQKVIAEVAKRSVTMIKTDEQAEGLLKSALKDKEIPQNEQFIASFNAQRDRMLQRDIGRSLLIRQRQQQIEREAMQRQQDAEDEESTVEMLLL